MKKYSLDKNWSYAESGLLNPLLVNMINNWKNCDLPHDYAMEKPRDPKAPNGTEEGYTSTAGLYYKKTFVIDESASDQRFFIEFEGIAGVCEIWVNNFFIAKHHNPYTGVTKEVTGLLKAGENTVTVHCDNRKKPDSRWYVGCGIFRHVWLYIAEKSCVLPGTLHICTADANADSISLDISALLSGKTDFVFAELMESDGSSAACADLTGMISDAGKITAQITVKDPHMWSVDDPYLYTLRCTVKNGDIEDVSETRTGIRTISVDSKEGFKLNGIPIKLKGGCIHHDLGLLGSASIDAAERRRIKTLKENGFTALRLAHNPYAPAVFDICDELGMMVVEEAFDEWVMGKTSFGLHTTFESFWEKDLEDMINRDFNHPSIIMWSTGNEVEERDGTADGYTWAARLAGKVRELDKSRPVSATACSLFVEYTQRPAVSAAGTTGNQALNMAYDNFASGVDLWGDATEKYFIPLDVAGYNYKTMRYEHDGERFPDRVIYGSESYPRGAFGAWQETLKNQNVIGDFVWTCWDYIGEVGTGRWETGEKGARPSDPTWPWLTANCGDINLIGEKRPQSYYRDVLWRRTQKPSLFCLSPEITGREILRMSWTWDPVQANYSYAGMEGEEMEAHIYANADEVELFRNGVSLGKKPCTKKEEYKAVYSIKYEPGTLEAVSYANGEVIGRTSLSTAGEAAKLLFCADRDMILGDGKDLSFVTITVTDENGNIVFDADGEINVEVMGGTLLALGSADPKPDRMVPFQGKSCPAYEGKVQAVIRSLEGGKGCLIKAKYKGIEGEATIGFAPCEADPDCPISEPKASAIDLTLGELLDNPACLEILRQVMGPMLDNPMLASMRGMSLRKLLTMGGIELPKPLADALDAAV